MRDEHSLPLELAAGGLAGVGEQVVALAEGVHLHNEVTRDLIPLPHGEEARQQPALRSFLEALQSQTRLSTKSFLLWAVTFVMSLK